MNKHSNINNVRKMTINLHTQRVTVPTAFVTKGRQRVKQYDNTIYLKDGDEFEIELFNPTTNKVLAKIDLNGKSLGSGIVLRPGERIFLERYFDEAKKFLFETYEVNGADPNVQQAIKKNGIVNVEFYDEHRPIVYHPVVYQQPLVYTYTWPYTYTGGMYNNTLTTDNVGRAQSATYCCNSISADGTNYFAPVETGRVEKGSNSDQSFAYDSTSFNTYYSWSCMWKILPESQRSFAKEDLKVFCTGCGAQRKKTSHKFCPNCGARF